MTAPALSNLGQPRQCGDDVLRMLVTGGPPGRGGGGMPQRIVITADLGALFASHVAFQLMDRHRLRPPNDNRARPSDACRSQGI
jgi:hypothetical protein